MNAIRKCVLLLLVLTYAGQGFAAGVPACVDMAPAGDMAQMSHAGHDMTSDSGADASPGDCCDGGLCGMNHCQSAPALPLAVMHSHPDFAAFYNGATETSFPLHSIDTLYRPPISR